MFNLLADITMILHILVGVFVLFGGLLILRYSKIYLIHIPVTLISLTIDLLYITCPITALENWLRTKAGDTQLHNKSFLEHYFSWLSTSSDTSSASFNFAILTIIINVLIYRYVTRKRKQQLEVANPATDLPAS